MNIAKYIFLILVLGCTTLTYAQPKDEPDDEAVAEIEYKSRLNGLVIGTSLNAGYNNGWIIGTTPSVGYRVNDNFIIGGGFRYDRYSFNPPNFTFKQVTTITGLRGFLQHYVYNDFYAHVEYESLTGTTRDIDKTTDQVLNQFRSQAPGLLLGGGYHSSFGFGFGTYVEILYNVLYDPNTTPYRSPFIYRVGIAYGF